jgi:hypothetical protein
MLEIVEFVVLTSWVGAVLSLLCQPLEALYDQYKDWQETRADHWELNGVPEVSDTVLVAKRRVIDGTGAFAEAIASKARVSAAEWADLSWAWVEDNSKPLFNLPGIKMTKEWEKFA